MERTNVLIIGGSASGIVTATTGKSCYPDKEFMVIRKEKQTIVPCGIPYIFGSLESSEKDTISDNVLVKAGVKFKIDEATNIDTKRKICETSDGTKISFEKLVFATGSMPRVPNVISGIDKENVFVISKDKEYLDKLLNRIKECKKIVVVGGGFIGVEVSDEINKLGKEVVLVEILPHILLSAFDEEMALEAESLLKNRGVKIETGVKVEQIKGKNKATGIVLNDGREIDADAVILSVGYIPNNLLAKKSGIALNKKSFIQVDEYMRTEDTNIFAVGDCAEKKDFFTRKTSEIMLASTACAEARIVGMGLYKLSAVKTFGGTIAIFSTAIGKTGFGVAGLTEKMAELEGFDIVTGSFKGIDRHPGTLPDTNKQFVKLIVARDSGMILGGEVIGGLSAGELTNIIGFAIQNKMTVNSLLTSQIGTHPLVTAPPTAYPLIKAAESASKKMNNR